MSFSSAPRHTGLLAFAESGISTAVIGLTCQLSLADWRISCCITRALRRPLQGVTEHEPRWRLKLRSKRDDPMGEPLRIVRLVAVCAVDEGTILRDRFGITRDIDAAETRGPKGGTRRLSLFKPSP